MPTASELLRQGKEAELWEKYCGYLSLSIEEFMEIQERLLIEQIGRLNTSVLGRKIMKDKQPKTVEEFRRQIPLTSYKDYYQELSNQNEDVLPGKPLIWAHSSGRTGEYEYKWIPLSDEFCHELSKALYGIGILSCCDGWGDVSKMSNKNKILYSVASRPYISGIFADLLHMEIPIDYLPTIDESEHLPFDERIKLGFTQALSQGFDYFFGLSLVLVTIGEKLKESSNNTNILPYLTKPGILLRLLKGKIKSRMAGRPMLPKDLWNVKGIIGSGTDSWVYKQRIMEYWGRAPLDLYSSTEAGVIASQTWDHEGMTFIPYLNFLEFIPEDEQLKNQMDRTYQPKTLLLNEVRPGENYEIVLTNFHGGSLIRYRPGDMVKITALGNETLGIKLPQMMFERRVDDVIELMLVRLTEKTIWQAIEETGIPYADWVAYKNKGDSILYILIELLEGYAIAESEIAGLIRTEIGKIYEDTKTQVPDEYTDMTDIQISVSVLPHGTFARYLAVKQAEGADIAHLKPPHVNPPESALAILSSMTEETIQVVKKKSKAEADIDNKEVTIS